jgi:Flp pilus assembly pilin Flp
LRRLLQGVWRERAGATLVEFALIAPALLLLLIGMFEMGYNYYMQSQLQGAVQKAARDSALHAGNASTAEIDAAVAETVRVIVPAAKLSFSRKAYSSFSDVNRPEDFTDVNADGRCNDGEPFEDANGNGSWDENRGIEGGGGARDAVLYVVTVSYPRAFGAARLVGLSQDFATQTTTVLRNQPWDAQNLPSGIGNCI